MSRFIIEGVDGAGKSTLAQRFVEAGYELIHCRYRSHESGIVGFYDELLRENRDKVIFDRSFISEAAYGPVLRGASRIDEATFVFLCEKYFSERDSTVIHMVEDVDTIRRRLSHDPKGEHSAVLRHLPQLLHAYDDAMRIVSRIGTVIEVSFSTKSAKEIEEFVAGRL